MSMHTYTLRKLTRLKRRVKTLEGMVMAFQDDLTAIAIRLQQAQDNANTAKMEADAAVSADVAQDTKIDAAMTLAQTALDEIATLVATLKGNPPVP